MVLHLIVKNFGKVESADIPLDNLVIFIGNNNSGKTMVMQLIYGIRKVLENFPVSNYGVKISDSNGQILIRCDKEWFREIEGQINKYLAEHNSQIMNDIFGIPVSAEEIKIALEGGELSYFVSSISECQDRDTTRSIDIRQYEDGKNIKSFEDQILNREYSEETVNEALNLVWRIILSGKAPLNSEQLFLPSSRSGLQLLYRSYFVEPSVGNLAMPVKDFLRFLQLYTADVQMDDVRGDLLKFGEEHLLQGKIIQKNDETFYVEENGGREIPLYIASSMIHELAPFIKALNAKHRIGWFYCDEVENCLHPLIQSEVARWLIRMVNAGMQVIISSHSDTMASRLNNLLMLTQACREKPDYGLLSELDLMDADLLSPDVKVGVYEFRSTQPGKTIVEKLEFTGHPLIGYDFQLFGKNLDKLYEEAERITR